MRLSLTVIVFVTLLGCGEHASTRLPQRYSYYDDDRSPTPFDGFYKGPMFTTCLGQGAEARLLILGGRARLAATDGTPGSFWTYPVRNINSDGSLDFSGYIARVDGRISNGVFEANQIPSIKNSCRWYMSLERQPGPFRPSELEARPAAAKCYVSRVAEEFVTRVHEKVSSGDGWCTVQINHNGLWPWDDLQLTLAPEHGEFRVRRGAISTLVDFKSTSGFVGQDHFSFRAIKANSVNKDYEIDVVAD